MFDIFFFQDTATTESDTSQHTLALRDALPICVREHSGVGASHVPGGQDAVGSGGPDVDHRLAERRAGAHVRGVVEGDEHATTVGRSEEHTSELQSLMRIQYAVFCLKKKKCTPRRRDTTKRISEEDI